MINWLESYCIQTHLNVRVHKGKKIILYVFIFMIFNMKHINQLIIIIS